MLSSWAKVTVRARILKSNLVMREDTLARVSPRITRFDFNMRARTLAVAQLENYMSVEKQTIHVTNIVLHQWFVSRARSCNI
jgi:hypothetical protein